MSGQEIVVRATAPHERRAAARVISPALLQSPPDDARWEQVSARSDPSRSFSAWEGDRCVGHAAYFPLDTTVPGGSRLPTGGVARVGVLPTHRRRGVASGLMAAVLDDAVERGLVLLSLRASEAPIYGRYGFGMAGDLVRAEIVPARARPLTAPDTGGRLRMLEAGEIRPTVEAVYEAALGRRAGLISRPELFWDRLYDDAVAGRNGRFVVAHHPAGSDGADGFVHYGVRWDDGLPDLGGVGEVGDLVALDDAVEVALWRYLLDVDLIRRWQAPARPVDDPVIEAMADRRAYRVTARTDEQWLRLVDVDRALAARTWNPVDPSLSLHVTVTDDRRPANSGTWRIDATGATRVDGPGAGAGPGLVTDVATLAAAYLGGTSWRALAAAGRVEGAAPDRLAVADALFASRPLPFCGTFF